MFSGWKYATGMRYKSIMEIIRKPVHGSLEWLTLRHPYIGASEVPALMGVSQYKTIIDLAIEKMQPPQVREQNNAMKRGTFLERGLLDYAEAELKTTIITPDEMYAEGRLIATLDGIAGAQIFECKTTTSWIAGSPIPPEWYWQAQAQMICTGADHVTFVVLDKRMNIEMFDVHYNDDDAYLIRERTDQFWQAVDAGKLPDDTPLSKEQVAQLHPEPLGEVEIGSTGLALVQEWQAVKSALADMTKRKEALENQLANILRDKQIGTIDGQPVISFKQQTTRRFNQKEFAQQHPDIYAQFQRASSFRVMRSLGDSNND